MDASLDCSSVDPNFSSFTNQVKKEILIKNESLTRLQNNCYPYVMGMYTLGEMYIDLQLSLVIEENYEELKSYYFTIKKALRLFEISPMLELDIQDLMQDTVALYTIYQFLITEIHFRLMRVFEQDQAWILNFKLPKTCIINNNTEQRNCTQIDEWFTVNGVDENAASLKTFWPVNTSEIGVDDFDWQGEMFKKEQQLIQNAYDAEQQVDNQIHNQNRQQNPASGRILEEIYTLVYGNVGINAGNDNSVSEGDSEVVTQISQIQDPKDNTYLNNISMEDAGVIGGTEPDWRPPTYFDFNKWYWWAALYCCFANVCLIIKCCCCKQNKKLYDE